MHSSRMRTGRSLTVFRRLLLGGGDGPGGVPGPGGYLVWGVYLVRGGTWSGGGCVPGPGGGCVPGQVLPTPVNRMTDRCKNITLAKTSFRPVMINYYDNIPVCNQRSKMIHY